ncbi:unnamed protein product, partial [Scytosiphon promiscuus]
ACIQATITVEALHEGVDFSIMLTRAKFEELNQDLFKNTLDVSYYACDQFIPQNTSIECWAD